jgi:hypothetical protein
VRLVGEAHSSADEDGNASIVDVTRARLADLRHSTNHVLVHAQRCLRARLDEAAPILASWASAFGDDDDDDTP